jgi:hypothetical protein
VSAEVLDGAASHGSVVYETGPTVDDCLKLAPRVWNASAQTWLGALVTMRSALVQVKIYPPRSTCHGYWIASHLQVLVNLESNYCINGTSQTVSKTTQTRVLRKTKASLVCLKNTNRLHNRTALRLLLVARHCIELTLCADNPVGPYNCIKVLAQVSRMSPEKKEGKTRETYRAVKRVSIYHPVQGDENSQDAHDDRYIVCDKRSATCRRIGSARTYSWCLM